MKKPLETGQKLHSGVKYLLPENSDLNRLPEMLRLCCAPAVGYICTNLYSQDELRLYP